jgi:hypothetical protein
MRVRDGKPAAFIVIPRRGSVALCASTEIEGRESNAPSPPGVPDGTSAIFPVLLGLPLALRKGAWALANGFRKSWAWLLGEFWVRLKRVG